MDEDFSVDLMDRPAAGAFLEALNLPKARIGEIGASTNDQRFLLVFIFGAYFGPDLRDDVPRKSALQRLYHHLPLYTADELGGSVFKLSEMESIYYYTVRHSHPSARVKLQSLYKFLQGHLAPPVKAQLEDDRQFTTFFPPHLHRQSRYKGTYKVVESIVFINEPDLSFMKPADIERFKRLTGLDDLVLDRDSARSYQHGQRTDRDEDRQAKFHALAEAHGHVQEGRPLPSMFPAVEPSLETRKQKKKKRDSSSSECMLPPLEQDSKPQWSASSKSPAAAMLLLPALPSVEEWSSIVNALKPNVVLTGTAAARQTGPPIGTVDIGVSDDAYLFRAALPGVKKDEADFHCQVEFDGKVTIKGVTTTGEQRILKKNRVFQMQTQYLCPPGPFTVSFRLPGPVEPTHFDGTFGSDGILEGVVLKARSRSCNACLTFET